MADTCAIEIAYWAQGFNEQKYYRSKSQAAQPFSLDFLVIINNRQTKYKNELQGWIYKGGWNWTLLRSREKIKSNFEWRIELSFKWRIKWGVNFGFEMWT